MFLEEVSTDVIPPVLPGVRVFFGGGVHDDNGLPQGGDGRTVMGADDACGGMWTAWAGAAIKESHSVGVMVAPPWTVTRRWWPWVR